MLSLFEKARFCSDCGNENTRSSNSLRAILLEPRTLCSDCSRRRQTPRRRLLLLLTVFATAGIGHATLRPDSREPVVSAWDASVPPQSSQTTPQVKLPTAAREQCGARTRKGTPCRRMVRPGERCSQHQGRPSMLKK